MTTNLVVGFRYHLLSLGDVETECKPSQPHLARLYGVGVVLEGVSAERDPVVGDVLAPVDLQGWVEKVCRGFPRDISFIEMEM